ncbi:MAG: discoidin domain-containing protein, partial [Flavisolibacter sp.]|nr:discoidin domain-containing protein [Flavisolibacter sp.]
KGRLLYGVAGKHYPKNYAAPIVVTESSDIAGLYYSGNKMLDSVSIRIHFNKATGKKVTLKEAPAKNYPGNGAFTLVDGIQNEGGLSRSREFLGFQGKDMEATLDLGTPQKINTVVVHSFQQENSWIYPPQSVEASYSSDGKSYKPLGTSSDFKITQGGNGTMSVNSTPVTARFVRVIVRNYGAIPEGKPGAGNKAWLFVDEIEVN